MTPSIYNNLFAICREAGLSEAYSRGVIRGFARRRPDDYAYLTELLTTTGCQAAAVRLITANYRSETGPPEAEAEARADDPVAELRRRRLRERRDKLEDLELARFEREMSGGGAPSAELDAYAGSVTNCGPGWSG